MVEWVPVPHIKFLEKKVREDAERVDGTDKSEGMMDGDGTNGNGD